MLLQVYLINKPLLRPDMLDYKIHAAEQQKNDNFVTKPENYILHIFEMALTFSETNYTNSNLL